MSYYINEGISDLEAAAKSLKRIQEFDPEARQRTHLDRHYWVSDKVTLADCTDFEIVTSKAGAFFVPFKLLTKDTPVYPADTPYLTEHVVLHHLRTKQPELYKALVEALQKV
jgi:hypothetical protein